MAGLIFKGVVLGNLIALNAIVYLGYRTFSGGLDLLERGCSSDGRATQREYDYFKKDLMGMQDKMLKSQRNLFLKAAPLSQVCRSSDEHPRHRGCWGQHSGCRGFTCRQSGVSC